MTASAAKKERTRVTRRLRVFLQGLRLSPGEREQADQLLRQVETIDAERRGLARKVQRMQDREARRLGQIVQRIAAEPSTEARRNDA